MSIARIMQQAAAGAAGAPEGAWDLSYAYFDDPNAWGFISNTQISILTVGGQETNPRALSVKPDGTKMYVLGQTGDDITEYTLSTPWLASSGTFVTQSAAVGDATPTGLFFRPDGIRVYVTGDTADTVREFSLSKGFSVATEETVPNGIFFKDDGTKMYVIGSTGDDVNEYNIGSPFSVAAEETNPTGIFFKPDGTKMYVIGSIGDDVNEYSLSSAWDISTASYVQNFSVATEETAPSGVFFKDDGTKMYVIGSSGDDVNEYSLSSAWDISTASYVQNFSVATEETAPQGIFFKPDGTKMYVLGSTGDDVNEYSLSSAWDISTASYVQNFSVATEEISPTGVFFKPDGTKMYVTGSAGQDVNEYSLSSAWNISTADWTGITNRWDLSTAVYKRNFSVATEETAPSGVFFKPDGTKMYVIGTAGDDVNEYSLSSAWDISTASYVQNFSVATEETAPQGIFFKPDGTKMYVIGSSGDEVNEYSLSSAWDISTASYVQNFSVATEDTAPLGVFFKPDGTKMYVLGSAGDDVNEYSLSSAWDVSTASYVQNFSVATEETVPNGIFFKDDGTKMYVIGGTGQDVNEYNLSSAWDISTASYVPFTGVWDLSTLNFIRSFSVSAQDTAVNGLFFKPDGTKMYLCGNTGDDINEYSLSVAWDVSSASYVQNFSVATENDTPVGVWFKSDGTEMYVLGQTSSELNEYSLSTPWDISTASFIQTNTVSATSQTPWGVFFTEDGQSAYIAYQHSTVASSAVRQITLGGYSVATQETSPQDVFFKPDGTKMYVIGSSGDDVNEYSLSSAWDVSTASYVQNFSVATEDTGPLGVFFKPDGTKMYVIGSVGDAVYEYSLSSAWDVSTASYVQNFSVAAQETNPTGVFFKDDGTKMYVIGSNMQKVNEYSLSSAWNISTAKFVTTSNRWDISTASYVQNFSVATEETGPQDVFFKPDGTKMYVIGTTGDDVNEYSLSSAWDISTASYVQNFSVATEETSPQGVFFKPDGTKMYVIGSVGDDVNEYSLSSAWDISTASYVQNFSVATEETSPSGVFFKPDGTKMYVIGFTGDDVNEYSLSSAWDISTASYVRNFSVAAQDTLPSGVFFKDDGTKMYVLGGTGQDINEYSLSSAWDISTASYVQNFSVATQEASPSGVFFKPDGTKMYVIGSTGDDVNEYNIGTGFSVAAQNTSPQGIFFKDDGTKMFISAANSPTSTYEYQLSSEWDLTTASYSGVSLNQSQLSVLTGIYFKPDGTKMFAVSSTTDTVVTYTLGVQP